MAQTEKPTAPVRPGLNDPEKLLPLSHYDYEKGPGSYPPGRPVGRPPAGLEASLATVTMH